MDVNVAGPVGIRPFVLEQICQTHEGHEHNYDHVTIVIRGRLKVTYSYMKDGQLVTGESREFGQGEWVTIKANVRHAIKALEANTQYYCVFSHRDFDGVVSQQYTGNATAYV